MIPKNYLLPKAVVVTNCHRGKDEAVQIPQLDIDICLEEEVLPASVNHLSGEKTYSSKQTYSPQ